MTTSRGSHGPGRASRPPPADAGAAGRDDALAAAVAEAVRETGAHTAVVFLRSRDRRSLVLAAAQGHGPVARIGGWGRIAVGSPAPAAVAYRSGHTVHLADSNEIMQRFPQVAVSLPYPFGLASVPVEAGGERFGALGVVWGTQGHAKGLSKDERRRLRATAARLGADLARLRENGETVECDPWTAPLEVAPPLDPALRVGLFDWDLGTDRVTADDETCAIFGVHPGEFDGRARTLFSGADPAAVPGFRAAARAAAEGGTALDQRLRVTRSNSPPHTVEVRGRAAPATASPARLTGAVVDLEAGIDAAATVEHLAEGVFSLGPDGRVVYANPSLETLLGVRREELADRLPWDVLPWLADPAFEGRFWSVMLSKQPTTFVARRPPGQWLAFSLDPGVHGVTGTVVPVTAPGADAEETGHAEKAGRVTATAAVPTRLGVAARVLRMSSALTEAVTAAEVCAVVTEHLLPAFGGDRTAIYAVDEGRLRLLAQRGYPPGALDRFEGIRLGARLPLTDCVTTGTPQFVEAGEGIEESYPGFQPPVSRTWAMLPMVASNRQVGVCVLGFDEDHRFSREDRAALTALGALIAQALERALLYDTKLALARDLQTTLLPHRLPNPPNLHVTGRYLPSTRGLDVGGDWYDVIPAADGGAALVIGDVEGHNLAAAATMGQLRSAVRAFATAGSRPRDVVVGTNRLLLELGSGLLASCCYVGIDPQTGAASAVRAGHLPPLLRHPGGRTEALDLPGGPILGVEDSTDYPETHLTLRPGSVLALYTDGLVEVPGTDLDLRIDRLRAALSGAAPGSLEELADRLLAEVADAPSRADDVALLLAGTRAAGTQVDGPRAATAG
jgi:PAS domain S-box-containing protein